MVELEVLSIKGSQLCKVQADTNWTVKELKKAVARQVPRLQECRQSLRDDPKGKDINNDKLLSSLSLNGRIYVKDLGPQISWTTVFLVEYAGPLFVYALFAVRPQFIYGESSSALSMGATVAWGCWSLHYVKRLLETVFVHRFSHGTMPIRNLFKNSGYYWGFAGYVAYHVNHPKFTEAPQLLFWTGLATFLFCEAGNFSIHILLRNLRPAGSTVRKIPVPDSNPLTLLFHLVSCPNYTYEFGSWIGFTLMTSCIPAGIFALAGMYQMSVWALGKHRNYKKEFKDYPKCRKAIVPFLL